MTTETLVDRFEKIGATVTMLEKRVNRWSSGEQAPDIDVKTSNRKETFVIDNYNDPDYTFEVIDINPEKRHLLLMMKKDIPVSERHDKKAEISKFLCGHDEFHWFVAAIPEEAHAKSIEEAMDALKPPVVQAVSQSLKKKDKNKRHNKAWKRQGEWFFIPVEGFNPDSLTILHNEPILRARSKPHMCEELVREGGQVLWFHWRYAPAGINDEQKRAIESAKGVHSGWQSRMVDASVYVRGHIHHPDHSTVYLDTWCRVFMNEETKAKARNNLRFLD